MNRNCYRTLELPFFEEQSNGETERENRGHWNSGEKKYSEHFVCSVKEKGKKQHSNKIWEINFFSFYL